MHPWLRASVARLKPDPLHFEPARQFLDNFAGLAVLVLLVFYTYALFFQVPYVGLFWNPSDGTITDLFAPGGLRVGDRLLQVGNVTFDQYRQNIRQPFFEVSQPQAVIPITVQRQDEILTVPWKLPGLTSADMWNRLSNQWWLAYVFWVAGQSALLFLRPRDVRRRVFIAFTFLTAIWLSASSLSQMHLVESAVVLRASIWLCVPVYWHLHWLVPKPLARVPVFLIYLGYGAAVALALAEWFQLLPPNSYAIGFLLASLGSMCIALAHFVLRPADRHDIALLVGGLLLAVGLLLVPGILEAAGASVRGALFTLLALPLLPLAYFRAAYRGQLAGLEIRSNRLISIYLFTILLATALVISVPVANSWLNYPDGSQIITLAAAALTGLAVAVAYLPFQRFVERDLLRIPLPPEHLVEIYADRISVSFTEQALVNLLRIEILPSLLVRQSALLRYENGVFRPAYLHGILASEIPAPADIAHLITEIGRVRTPDTTKPSQWVRLALALNMDGVLQGLWLFGRRDPDDRYDQAEIQVLKSLANQTAIALTNIVQAESLRALYQRDIEQTEYQRYHVARELHDHLLNEIARLETSLDESLVSPEFLATCESLITSIRQTISDLRPDALNYGLYHALIGLRDDLADRYKGSPSLNFEGLTGAARYNPLVELHIYRVVQQACDNARKHANPRTLTVRGELLNQHIQLSVEDDGKGFEFAYGADVARLAADKHYGLAGMFERAAISGARLTISSAPGQGTRVQIAWPAG